MTVDSATAASLNGFCSYKLFIHKKTNIMQIMTKNIKIFIYLIFYHILFIYFIPMPLLVFLLKWVKIVYFFLISTPILRTNLNKKFSQKIHMFQTIIAEMHWLLLYVTLFLGADCPQRKHFKKTVKASRFFVPKQFHYIKEGKITLLETPINIFAI